MIDDEGNEFLIASMVVEGEYITLDGKSRSTSGHVFVDYRPGSVVYLFTNLIVGMNIHLQTMSTKNSTKVRYFLPHSENEMLMETIRNKEDPYGYIECDWVIALTLHSCETLVCIICPRGMPGSWRVGGRIPQP